MGELFAYRTKQWSTLLNKLQHNCESRRVRAKRKGASFDEATLRAFKHTEAALESLSRAIERLVRFGGSAHLIP